MKIILIVYNRIFDLVEEITKLMLVCLAVVVIIQVISRFLHMSIMWTVELSRFLFPWLGFLGLVVAARKNAIPKFTLFSDRLSGIKRHYYYIFINIMTLIFLTALLFASGPILRIAHDQRMPLIPLQWSYVYVSMTTCLVLLIFIYMQRVVETVILLCRKE